ncbi:MAG: hypothetical protein M3P06_05320 [Acidobacteriota bacterium]|nr:hypothetical protein [Acidobacteriota bacterium]
MKRILFLVVFTLLSFSVFADDTPSVAPGDGPTASWCDASECGDLPPSPGEPGGAPVGGGGGTVDTCIKSTNYTTCLQRCTCKYNEAYKKCGKWGWWCKQIALADKEACQGGCLSDYAP